MGAVEVTYSNLLLKAGLTSKADGLAEHLDEACTGATQEITSPGECWTTV